MARCGYTGRFSPFTTCFCSFAERSVVWYYSAMTQPFECEVRFRIESIEKFEARLRALGARIAYSYEFTDHYYKPADMRWDPVEKNIRIRQWTEPRNEPAVYLVKLEIVSIEGLQFKRSLYPEGKLPLFTGPLEACRTLLADLGFEFWFSLKKQRGRLWEVPVHRFCTAAEYIEGLGWTAELEFDGNDPQTAKSAIKQALKVLDVPQHKVTHKPISAIYLEGGNVVSRAARRCRQKPPWSQSNKRGLCRANRNRP